MKKTTLIGWLLMLISAVALMGSDSECQVELDDGELQIDSDRDDDIWDEDFWDDVFDKRIVSDASGLLQPIPQAAAAA